MIVTPGEANLVMYYFFFVVKFYKVTQLQNTKSFDCNCFQELLSNGCVARSIIVVHHLESPNCEYGEARIIVLLCLL